MHPIVDAFWKGRTKFKKTEEVYFDREKNPRAACHIGAIYWGLYKKVDLKGCALGITYDYPEFLSELKPIPCEHAKDHLDPNGYIGSILIHLNDEHDGRSWPDKRVAEWLEGVLV
jgi:hypothetical protein